MNTGKSNFVSSIESAFSSITEAYEDVFNSGYSPDENDANRAISVLNDFYELATGICKFISEKSTDKSISLPESKFIMGATK